MNTKPISGMFTRLCIFALIGFFLISGPAHAGPIKCLFLNDFFPVQPGANPGRADLFSCLNQDAVLKRNIVKLTINLPVGLDKNNDGVGMFFDTVFPSAEAPPGPGQNNPGFDGAAPFTNTGSQFGVGLIGGPNFTFPIGVPVLAQGDGAWSISFDFRPNKVNPLDELFDLNDIFSFGIDVDGFVDAGVAKSAIPVGAIVAAGEVTFSDNEVVQFDVVKAISEPASMLLMFMGMGLVKWFKKRR